MTKRELFIKQAAVAIMGLDESSILKMRKAEKWAWTSEADGGFDAIAIRSVKEEFLAWAINGVLQRDPTENWSCYSPYSGGFWMAVREGKDENGPWLSVNVGWGLTAGDDGEVFQ